MSNELTVYEYCPDPFERPASGPSGVQVYQYVPTTKQEPVLVSGGTPKMGDFYLSDLSESLGASFSLLVFFVWPRRLYGMEAAKANNEPTCLSPDGETGTIFGDCSVCQRANWDIARSKGAKSPPCKEIYTFIGLLGDKVVSVDFKGASMASAKAFVRGKKQSRRNYFERIAQISTAKVGAYYKRAISLTDAEPSEESKKKAYTLAKDFLEQFQKSRESLRHDSADTEEEPF